MQKWSDQDGVEFRNSDLCYGREYKPDGDSNKIDIAKISIRGEYPEGKRWGYLEESHEMAVVIRGKGYILTKKEGRTDLVEGDVVYVEPKTRFKWGGDMDMVVPCGPAFYPEQHKFEDDK
jgi:hypothetical protein